MVNSSEQMIDKINTILRDKKDAVINIVNDKLTISVFMALEANLKKRKADKSSNKGYTFCP